MLVHNLLVKRFLSFKMQIFFTAKRKRSGKKIVFDISIKAFRSKKLLVSLSNQPNNTNKICKYISSNSCLLI